MRRKEPTAKPPNPEKSDKKKASPVSPPTIKSTLVSGLLQKAGVPAPPVIPSQVFEEIDD